MPRSVELRHIDPASFRPGLQSELRELHALRALQQAPGKRVALDDVAEKQLPLDLERVVIDTLIRHRWPAVEIFDRAIYIRIPKTTGRGREMLCHAVPQSRHGSAVRAIDLQRE